jgi:heat shock protein HslJ
MRVRHLLIIATLVACRTTPTPAPAGPLGSGQWRLLDVGGTAAVPEDASRRPWLRFTPDSNRVNGHFGCNTARGSYTTEAGASLRFSPMMTTRMACADQRMNVQEGTLGAAVDSTDSYRIVGDTLELRRGERSLARFLRLP